jgi:hypothetical protein
MLFGEFLVSEGYCTQEDVDVALDAQRAGDKRVLVTILYDNGVLTLEKAKQAVEAYPRYDWDQTTWEEGWSGPRPEL